MKKIVTYVILALLLTQGALADDAATTVAVPGTATEVSEEAGLVETEVVLEEQADEMSEEAVMATEKSEESNMNVMEETEDDSKAEASSDSFYDKFIGDKVGFGVGVGAGGFELKGIYRINKFFSTSLDYNYMAFDDSETDTTDTDEEYTINSDITISSIKALAHWHVFGGGFRVSAGVVKNLSDIELTFEGKDFELKEGTTSDFNGTIIINTGDVLPYVGLGWGYGVDNRWALDLAIGVQFIEKIKGSDLIDADFKMESEALEDFINEVASDLNDTSSEAYQELVNEGLSTTEIAEVQDILANDEDVQAAIATGDPFEVYDILEAKGILEKFGIETNKSVARSSNGTFDSLPDPDDYIADLEQEIDDMVEDSGLGAIQDIFGFAPLPVASLGLTIFLW